MTVAAAVGGDGGERMALANATAAV